MKAVRHRDRGALRWLLDEVTRQLQGEALEQWVEGCIPLELQDLPIQESLQQDGGYLQEFGILGMKVESPEYTVAGWPETMRPHVRIALS